MIPFHRDICFKAAASIHADVSEQARASVLPSPVGGVQGHALQVSFIADLCLQALQILG